MQRRAKGQGFSKNLNQVKQVHGTTDGQTDSFLSPFYNKSITFDITGHRRNKKKITLAVERNTSEKDWYHHWS